MSPTSEAAAEVEKQWYRDPEEFANSVTHGVGFVASSVGAVLMLARVGLASDVWRVIGVAAFVLSLVAVYAMSTLSHVFAFSRDRERYRRLDQAFIFLLIASTYTPFSLTYLRTVPWNVYLGLIWTIALSGFVSKLFLGHRVEAISVWIYILLGWMPIVAAPALIGLVSGTGLWWMLIGGLCYTFGTIFLIMDGRVPRFHALWHLSVISGSACHFGVIWRCIAN